MVSLRNKEFHHLFLVEDAMWTARNIIASFAYKSSSMLRTWQLLVILFLLSKAWLCLLRMECNSLMCTCSTHWVCPSCKYWLDAVVDAFIHQRCMLELYIVWQQLRLYGRHCFSLDFVPPTHVTCGCGCLNRPAYIMLVFFIGILLHAAESFWNGSCHIRLRLEHWHLFCSLWPTTHRIEDTIVPVAFVSLCQWSRSYAHRMRCKHHVWFRTVTLCVVRIPTSFISIKCVSTTCHAIWAHHSLLRFYTCPTFPLLTLTLASRISGPLRFMNSEIISHIKRIRLDLLTKLL